MTRYFNTEGCCRPDQHYMVRLDERLRTIKEQFVDRGKYFVINKGRQYGKTTTLRALSEYLKEAYIVVSMDFQRMSTASFADEHTFVLRFIGQLEKLLPRKKELMKGIDESAFQNLILLKDRMDLSMDILFEKLSDLCEASERPIVMMIDEVDSASNNQVFIDFLAQLRGYYLDREYSPIFHSVILAGVYDIKNLKLKIRPVAEHQYNSPWNIAADFDIDMSFPAGQISEMLMEYDTDHHTGMDVSAVADEIYQYTSGYPYLVSAICKIMDEKLPCMEAFADRSGIWTKNGVEEAVRIILKTKATLFDSMTKHISEYPALKEMLYVVLFQGEQMVYNQDNHTIELACMFGYVINDGTYVKVANRIFETRLYNLFLSEEELSNAMSREAKLDRNQFVSEGRLDMERVLAKFVEHFHDIYGDNNEKFMENDGRKFFLLYLRPIINGTGNYYIEAQTRDERRTGMGPLYKTDKKSGRIYMEQSAFDKIYEIVKQIPYGQVATYGQIAALAGNKRWARVVGYALHVNPDPDHIPCYRVVNKDGRVSDAFAFGGGNRQVELLKAEGVEFAGDCVKMAQYQWERPVY